MRINEAPGKAQGKEELRQGVPGRVAETIVCDFFYQDAVGIGKRPHAPQLIPTDVKGGGASLLLSEQRISDIIFVTFSVHTRETRPRSKDSHRKEGTIGRPQATSSRGRCLDFHFSLFCRRRNDLLSLPLSPSFYWAGIGWQATPL